MTVKAVRIKNILFCVPEKEREVRILILITAVFTASMIVGAGCVNFIDSTSLTEKTINFWLSERNQQTFIQIFINSFIINIMPLSAIFLCGLSCVGFPFVSAIFIIKGLSLGYIAGYLFSLSAKGIGYYLINIVPANLIFISGLFITTMHSIQMTNDITMCINDKKKLSEKCIRNYIIRFIIIIIITAFASFTDGVFCKTYSYLFSF